MSHLVPGRQKLYRHDIIAKEVVDRHYTVEAWKFTNALGQSETIDDVIGLPLNWNTDHFEIADHAGSDGVDGIVVGCLDGVPNELTLANSAESEHEYWVAVRGPLFLNGSKIHTEDPEEDEYSLVQIEAALKALDPPILLMWEPAKTSTQTT